MQTTDEDYACDNTGDNHGTATLNEFANWLASGSYAMTTHREWRTPRQPLYPALRKIIGEPFLRDDHAPDATN